jgi:hypothetical protein
MEEPAVAGLRTSAGEPMTTDDATHESHATHATDANDRGGARRLMLRVLIVQALTLLALYLLQLRFGIGAGA